MAKDPKVFIAKVNLTYEDESRLASIYEDGTAILDNGETVILSQAQINRIKERKAQAEQEAAEKIRVAAQAARDRYEEEQRVKILEKVQPPTTDNYEEYNESEINNDNSNDSYEDVIDESEEEYYDSRVSGKKSVAKIILSTVGLFAVCGGILAGSFYLLDNHLTRVTVAQFSTNIAKDQLITPDNLERLKMPESVYRELTDAARGDVVLWQEAQGIVGKYAAMDAIAGQYVTTDYVADSMTENLWKISMDEEQQMVNLDFDRFELDEIYPGSHISIKAVIDAQTSSAKVMTISEAASYGEEQERAKAEAEAVNKQQEETNNTEEENSSNQEENIAKEDNTETEEVKEEPATSPRERVDNFKNIMVVDLKNNNNESIFDLYLALTSMTSEARKEYLLERAKSANANAYRESLIPTVLVMALDEEQAKDLSVVKNMNNAALQFATIPSGNYDSTPGQNSLLMKFKEVDRDIREIFSAARTK